MCFTQIREGMMKLLQKRVRGSRDTIGGLFNEDRSKDGGDRKWKLPFVGNRSYQGLDLLTFVIYS